VLVLEQRLFKGEYEYEHEYDERETRAARGVTAGGCFHERKPHARW
jgi:hypothetical protein